MLVVRGELGGAAEALAVGARIEAILHEPYIGAERVRGEIAGDRDRGQEHERDRPRENLGERRRPRRIVGSDDSQQ